TSVIDAVPFERFGHVLFDDENLVTNRFESRLVAMPVGKPHVKCRIVHRRVRVSYSNRRSSAAPFFTLQAQRPPTGNVNLSGTCPNGNPVYSGVLKRLRACATMLSKS